MVSGKKFYFNIASSGDYKITLCFSAPDQYYDSDFMNYGYQDYVDFSVE